MASIWLAFQAICEPDRPNQTSPVLPELALIFISKFCRAKCGLIHAKTDAGALES
jgi:hypothetical protein